jgi:hypothetical protein
MLRLRQPGLQMPEHFDHAEKMMSINTTEILIINEELGL